MINPHATNKQPIAVPTIAGTSQLISNSILFPPKDAFGPPLGSFILYHKILISKQFEALFAFRSLSERGFSTTARNEFYHEFYIIFIFWLPVLPIKDNPNRYIRNFKIERPIIGVIGKICFFACRGIRYKRNLIDFFCLKKGLFFVLFGDTALADTHFL